MASLQEYSKKRNFKKTPEPGAFIPKQKSNGLTFVVQEHHASHLHYDFRLEIEGVLKSWAVPKGPSLDPSIKRLAVEVEDHPLPYAKFEGHIPASLYGGGDVYIWDTGTWMIDGDPTEAYRKGKIYFTLKGKKLKGDWLLLRTQRPATKPQWLLMKRNDSYADPVGEVDIALVHDHLNPLDRTPKSIPSQKRTPAKSPPTQKARSKTTPEDFTSPDKIYYIRENISKLQVAQFQEIVFPWMSLHLSKRPLSMVRCPNGTSNSCFYQKHFKGPLPQGLQAIQIKEKTATRSYVMVETFEGLRSLTQQAVIELHGWNCRAPDTDHPDQVVFDLDPGPRLKFQQVIEAAWMVKELVESAVLQCFVKTTGGKGLHVHVPLQPVHTWAQIKDFCWDVAHELEIQNPKLYTTSSSKALRDKKIYIDILRNAPSVTAIIPYSLRAREISSVAMPLDWDELRELKSGHDFSMSKALSWINNRKEDPWKDYFQVRQKLLMV
ncbi:MAG: non-homologous end-joining DNA ligase [Pseudobdellovibrionaceae bacterium]